MNLKGLLEQYKEFPGLSVQWIMVGPSDREERPPHGGALRHYDRCKAFPHEHVKTIVNSYFVLDVLHPHNQRYRYAVFYCACSQPTSLHCGAACI